jgi:uncharacterized protein (DUF302 family)
MSTYTLQTTGRRPYDEMLEVVRAQLGEVGFGVLTEVDLSKTLKQKLGVDVPRQVILGACRPPLAYEALRADPSVATLLPCNVVVREVDPDTTVVEAFDPAKMVTMSGDASDAVREVADDARSRLLRMLAAVGGKTE